MPFQIIRNNIVNVKADAIVNTANPKALIGGGVDSAIYAAAGSKKLLKEREKIGNIARGEAAITPAFNLPAKYIIHTVGPAWDGGDNGELEQLKNCYDNSLKLAVQNNCKSIAFPLISTGVYGFPKDRALRIAIDTVSAFIMENDINVILVVFDAEAFELSGKLFDGIDEFIDDNFVDDTLKAEYCRAYYEADELKTVRLDENISTIGGRLSDALDYIGETFQERLFRLIDEKGMSDVEVYKRANLDRKLFSKIRCNKHYKPKKMTVLALAIALQLNLDDTKDLLARAEFALSPSSRFDLIVEYFIENEVYDIYAINMALFKYQQPTLGL